MTYTYRYFISIFLQLYSWWYMQTGTLYQFFSRWTRDDIYIPQLYINFSADAQEMIYTYCNFISTFLEMNPWWYIHAETLYQFSFSCTRNDIYIPQLYINFLADEHGMIYTYCNFITTLLEMNTWWYIHTATWYELSCRWAVDDIYTYCNFISFFQQMNTWWYIHTASLYQFFGRWTRDDIYILQLYNNFAWDEHVMIYTYRNFISTFLQLSTGWYICTETLYQFSSR